MNRVSVKAVIVGGLADILCAGFLDVMLLSLLMARLGVLHSVGRHAHAAAVAAIQGNAPLQGLGLLIGLGSSALGGYVAARLAGRNELLNGACSSLLGLLFGGLTLATGRDSRFLPFQVIVLIASPVCGAVGGYLEALRLRRAAPPKLA